MGDIKTKPDEPYGDFIIFNEMMSYALEQKTDIVFLTYDTTKGDWMKYNKQPHIHYIENFYLNTKQIIYILDAKRIFEETLGISFTSLIKLTDNSICEKVDLNLSNLQEFLNLKYPNGKKDTEETINELYLELIHNGYDDLNYIKSEVDKANDAYYQYVKEKNNGVDNFTRVGNLRIRLDIINENYAIKDETHQGEYVVQLLNRFKEYNHLVCH